MKFCFPFKSGPSLHGLMISAVDRLEMTHSRHDNNPVNCSFAERQLRKRQMNWDAIAAIAELLAALGVIGSLVYLAGQVRGSLNQARNLVFDRVSRAYPENIGNVA